MRGLYNDFLIDGQPVLVPDSGVQLRREDVESDASGMDERGVYHRFVLRHRVKRWTLRYSLLTGQELHYMRRLLEGKQSVTVRYREPHGELEECTAWCSADSGALVDQQQELWQDLVLTLSEC